MALPATDSFTAAADGLLTAYSANWAATSVDMWVFATPDSVTASANSECACRWSADAFNANQYSQAVIEALGTINWTGVAVRCAAGAATYYGLYPGGANQADSYLFKMVAGTFTQIGATGGAWVTSDTIRLEVSGTTLTPIRNGSTYATIGAQTDASIASGSAGLCGYGDESLGSVRVDNWQADNLGGATKAPPPRRRPYRFFRRAG